MAATEYQKLYQRARVRAVQELIRNHYDEWSQLLHAQKHAVNLSHRHDHDDLSHTEGEHDE